MEMTNRVARTYGNDMPDSVIFITLQELGYPKPSIGDALRIVRGLNKRIALKILARFNIDLGLAAMTGDWNVRNVTQNRIISQIISERRRRELAEKLRDARVDRRPLVHRGQLLLAMKLVVAFGRDHSGNSFERRDDYDCLGELALIINSLFDFENLSGLEADALERELAAQMSPLFELNNPEPLGNGIVRMHAMLGDLYERYRWQKILKNFQPQPNIARQLERLIVFITGTNFQQLQDLTFAVHAFYNGRRDEILKGTADVVMNIRHPGSVIGTPWLRRFLDQHSFDVERLEVDSLERGRQYFLDYTIFRQCPIWRLDPERYLCLDLLFIVEKLTAGTYWSINAALSGPDPESMNRTQRFAEFWGLLFEEYVLSCLSDIYTAGPLSPLRARPKYVDGTEAFDAIIEAGDVLITIQIKAMLVPLEAKCSGAGMTFFAGINEKFGLNGGALEQHLRNIASIFNRIETACRNIPGVPDGIIRMVIPVVITQESVLKFGPVTKVLGDEWERAIDGTPLRPGVTVSRPVFLAIDELESLAPHLIAGDLTVHQALQVKLGNDHQMLSFWDAFREEYLRPGRLPTRQNALVQQRYQRASAEALQRFECDYSA